MTRNDYISAMSEMSALEGVFTSGQAAQRDVIAKVLSQAVASGRAERVAHGAYRLAGVPATERNWVTAIWKLIAPAKFTHERMAVWGGIVVGDTSAANILGIGDSWLSPYWIYARKRKIESLLADNDFKNLFIDEVQNVRDYEGSRAPTAQTAGSLVLCNTTT